MTRIEFINVAFDDGYCCMQEAEQYADKKGGDVFTNDDLKNLLLPRMKYMPHNHLVRRHFTEEELKKYDGV